MACHIEIDHSIRLSKIASLSSFLFLTVVLASHGFAQKAAKPNHPKYDLQTETKIKGAVLDVKLPPKGSEKEIVHLLVKNGADTADIYLCPKSFMDDMAMEFAKGDDVIVTGSKVKLDQVELILAREIVRKNDTFALRDGKGEPVWDWHH